MTEPSKVPSEVPSESKAVTVPPWGRTLGLLLAGFLLGAIAFGVATCGSSRHESPTAEADADATKSVWTCSMHTQIRQPEPGQCPICGMDLIPVESSGQGEAPNKAQVVLSERAKTLAELRTTEVRRRASASAELRLLGRVQTDETTLRTVTAWTGGRIERLFVNVTGEHVRAGQTVATLYSPEIFAAQQDLIAAKRQVQRLSAAPEASRSAAGAALEAAGERLSLLGVPDAEVTQMEAQKHPSRAVSIRTPFGGTVIERLATAGAYVATGAPLYRIADLTKLWLQLDAYENDLSRISIGQPVKLTVESLPGEEFEGKVAFIDPTLDPERRTAKVRVELKNRDGRLRPGVFAEADLSAAVAKEGETGPLVIPDTAPLFTGVRALVYLEVPHNGQTAYEARTVRLGPRVGHYYPVVAGLSEGDRVVSRGAFALDADLQIRGGTSMMTLPDDSDEGSWDGVIELSSKERSELAPAVKAYLAVQRALANDDLNKAHGAAEGLATAVTKVQLEQPREAAELWGDLSAALMQHARHISAARDLEGARSGFEALSLGIETLLRRLGNPLRESLHLAFCPMASGSRGASWIQEGMDIENAYFGASMHSCGEVRSDVAPGTYLEAPHEGAPDKAMPHEAMSPSEMASPGEGHAH